MSNNATNIRRQLGPARKRVKDRIEETKVALQGNDVSTLKKIRVKLKANMEYHEKLTEHLCNVSAADEDEQKAIEADIDTCTELNMDGHEWLCSIDEMISDAAPEDSKMGHEVHLKQS